MKTYKQLIIEATMSVHDALKIFGMDQVPTDKELAIKYRELAKKFHPDHGGSVTDMQKLNAANDFLKKYAGTDTIGPKVSYADTSKEYWKLAKVAKSIIKKKFNEKAYTSYFENIFQKRFSSEMSFYPEKESGAHPYYAGLKAQFISDDKQTIFDLNISIYLTDMRRTGSLSGGDLDITLHVIAYGFHDNRKQKMAQRDWNYTNTHSILDNPQEIFPEAKLRKSITKKKGKFAKKDAFLFFTSKFQASVNKEFVYIPLENGIKIVLYRITFMKEPFWMPNGVYQNNKRIRVLSTWYLPENEDAFKELEGILNKLKKETDPEKIDKALLNLKNIAK